MRAQRQAAACLGVQRLQVGGQVVDALRVQELADDVAGLQRTDRGRVLRNRAVIVVLGVQVVAVAPLDLRDRRQLGLRCGACSGTEARQACLWSSKAGPRRQTRHCAEPASGSIHKPRRHGAGGDHRRPF
jgi:hypothetical protein